jgi:DNA-binding NtrC family response regulator
VLIRENDQALVIDDEPEMLAFLERVLRSRFRVRLCGSVREALWALAEQPFQVLVTDLKMPEMDGLALLERIDSRHPALARVLLSGYGGAADLARARGLVDAWLPKPVDSDAVVRAIDDAMRRRNGMNPESG